MEKLGIKQAKTMLRLQDRINSAINPNWLSPSYPFLRAILVEVGETFDRCSDKWWAKQESGIEGIEQVRTRLLHILRFMLSDALAQLGGDHATAAQWIVDQSAPHFPSESFDGKVYALPEMDIEQLLELLGGLAVSRRNALPVLERCFQRCDLNWNAVTRRYVSESVLNLFRQNNGYKEGAYRKEWDGKEDSVHLAKIVGRLDPSSHRFSEDLYCALAAEYEKARRAFM